MTVDNNQQPLRRGLFITGTDTGIGKTHAASALMRAFAARHLRVAGMKPVASGCVETDQGLVNDDTLALQKFSTTRQPYDRINPYAFKEPIAPHIAAARAGVSIDIGRIRTAYTALAAAHDITIVEGAGGWRVPLTTRHFFSDLVHALQIPVVLVVGLRLGCINHALLTARAVIADGGMLAGWIANTITPEYGEIAETLDILSQQIPAKLTGIIPYQSPPGADHPLPILDTTALLAR